METMTNEMNEVVVETAADIATETQRTGFSVGSAIVGAVLTAGAMLATSVIKRFVANRNDIVVEDEEVSTLDAYEVPEVDESEEESE